MQRKEILGRWLAFTLLGTFLVLLGHSGRGGIGLLLFVLGVSVNLIPSVFCLLRMRPYKTRFALEATLLCLAWLIPFTSSLYFSSPPLLPLFFLLAILPPAIVLGTLLAEHIGASWILRIPIHAAVLVTALFAMLYLGIRTETPEPPHHEVVADALADKHPAFIDAPEFWKRIPYTNRAHSPDSATQDTLEMNQSGAVIALDLPAVERYDAAPLQRRFSSYQQAIDYLNAEALPWIPSVQMVDHEVKTFADAAYAAIDRHTQREAEALGGGRQIFLEKLLSAALAEGATDTAAFAATALRLSDAEPAVPPEVDALAHRMQANFLADAFASKPIGFYAEDEALGRVFQQNRFCQQDLFDVFDKPGIAGSIAQGVAHLLAQDAELRASYDAILALQTRTTNPSGEGFIGLNGFTPEVLRTPGIRHIALFPPSGSKENALYLKLYDGMETLPQENIMHRLIQAIRDGDVDLTPDEQSGWYDYQVHALETLLLPDRAEEGAKLLLSKAYKERLIEAFQTILTKQRELHVGHLYAMDAKTSAPMGEATVRPDLALEPTATYYLRTARALRFLENAVQAMLGKEDYATITLASGESLAEALPPVAQLLYGCYFQVCEDIGMAPELLDGELTAEDAEEARAKATAWLDPMKRHEAMAGDVRYIVPLMIDAAHEHVRYWMTTGIRLVKLEATYASVPRFRLNGEILDENEPLEFQGITLDPATYYLPVEEFAEATGPNVPLTRAEFRALCDRAGRREAIVRAVENGRHTPVFPLGAALMLGAIIAVVLVAHAIRQRRRSILSASTADEGAASPTKLAWASCPPPADLRPAMRKYSPRRRTMHTQTTHGSCRCPL